VLNILASFAGTERKGKEVPNKRSER